MRLVTAALAVALAGASLVGASDGITTGGEVDESGWGVWAHTSGDDGSSGAHGSSSGNADGVGSISANGGAADSWQPPGSGPRTVVCDSPDGCPGSTSTGPGAPPRPPAGAPATPGLSDVARFLVGNPTVTSEPSGWTIAGAQTNFIAGAGEREQAGVLLGQPVAVHFTPVSYAWRYGDGMGQVSSSAGASWAASGLPNFSETATSHAYENRGSYTVTVTVQFAARYEFAGQGWVGIPGTLGLTSNPITVTVKGVKTVLVGKTCIEDPAGPGCS